MNCASFSNGLQTMTFAREGCADPANYAGGEVADTVLAGTYFSNNSQAEADSLAIAYLLVNGQAKANATCDCLPLMSFILSNYEHIAGFTITLTSVRDSGKVYTIEFPENSNGTLTLERVPQGSYNVEISKTGNVQSFLFTVSGPAGEIQLNSDRANWTNVPVYANLFNRISIGLSQ